MILIADSGSTKTDWALVGDNCKTVCNLQTEGITPIHQSEEHISMVLQSVAQMLSSQISDDSLLQNHPITSVYFYGSGIIAAKKAQMEQLLGKVFTHSEKIEAHGDLLGAARALCGHRAGIACILGTGANSCYYDGEQIVQNTPPLGYILGDEGSGAVLGKLFLNAIFKGALPSALRDDYLQSVGMSYAEVIDRVYRQPMANRFLASTSLYIGTHLSCEPLHQLVVDNFRAFVRCNVDAYHRRDLPINAIGSMAWHYREQLHEAVVAEGYTLGIVAKSPMEGLVQYHGQC